MSGYWILCTAFRWGFQRKGKIIFLRPYRFIFAKNAEIKKIMRKFRAKIDAKILRKNSKIQRKRCKIHQKRLNFAKFSHFANIFALFIFAKRFVCWKPYYQSDGFRLFFYILYTTYKAKLPESVLLEMFIGVRFSFRNTTVTRAHSNQREELYIQSRIKMKV